MSAEPSILGSAKLRQGPGVVLIMLDLCLGRHLAARRGGSGRAAAAKSQKMNFVYEQDLVWRRPHDLGAGGGSEWIRMCITARNMGY